ncbi:MAG: DUF2147 domain-containing protein [Woeseiaceae bacterium]
MNPARLKLLLAVALLAGLTGPADSVSGTVPAIDGTWLSGDGDGWIEISTTRDTLSGIIAGSPNASPERPDTDEKNPDPALRDRPLVGLELFAGFEYDGNGRWSGGTIYDPNSGKTYRCIVTVVDEETLKVRGYVGVPLLGRTEIWKRVKD